jgi:hypothetical protein
LTLLPLVRIERINDFGQPIMAQAVAAGSVEQLCK